MRRPYLEVTFRKGKPLVACIHLRRPSGARAARSEEREAGLVVDFAVTGEPIGVEITTPSLVDLARLNRVLNDLGVLQLATEDLAPLRAA